jgi:hypothetical protein
MKYRVNWAHLIFILIMLGFTTLFFIGIFKLAKDHKEAKQQRLRELYSPMSDSPEIQEAYDAVRDPVFDLDAYVINGDTLATENI